VRDTRERLVIVGFGIAAHRFVERLRWLDALDRYDLTVFGEEPLPAYNRVRLTEWLDHGDLGRLVLPSRQWSADHGVRVVTDTRVVSIDRERRVVETADAERVGFDRLVLATGSAPVIPRIEGADGEGVFVYRTFQDLERIRSRALEAKRAVVVGGGLLGIEVAEGLRRMGLHVVVVERSSHLLSRQFARDAGTLLETAVRRVGIQPMPGAGLTRIEARSGGALALKITGLDMPLVTDMVVLAAGVRPRDQLARACGISVAYRTGGIVVNDRLRSSDPSIHAIGECACHRRAVHGQAGPGYRMAEVLADIMAGGDSLHGRYTPTTRLRLVGIDIWALGDTAVAGETVTWCRSGSYRQLRLRAGQIISATSIGPWEELSVVQDFIDQRRPVWPWQLRRFRRDGMLLPHSVQIPVVEWPPTRVVCNCLGVTRAALTDAWREGCDSVEAVAARTGASSVCGACRPLLSELVGDVSARTAENRPPGLPTAAAAVLILALVIALGPPTPLATSVMESGFWDVLYRDGGWRQITGFTVLGCALATLGLSLRKRWRRIRFASMGMWRLAHAALAGLSLVALVTHTGLRLGSGLNLMLTLSFLCATVFGTAAAAGFGHRRARTLFWLHVIAVWPLPVLLAFHILSAYYF